MAVPLIDPYDRTVRDLRISVTDRCNFRCTYCMPREGMQWLPRDEVLSYELLARPGLRKMAGFPAGMWRREEVTGIADESWRGAGDGRTSFVRVVATFGEDGRLHARGAGGQGSHQLHAMSLSNALAVVEPGVTVAPGDRIRLMTLFS